MEKVSTLNGTTEIYHLNGQFNLTAGQIMELEMAGNKEVEETVPADHTWTIRVRMEIIEEPV